MHGRITKFSDEVGFGVIEADDGSKYRFAKTEIKTLDRLRRQRRLTLTNRQRP